MEGFDGEAYQARFDTLAAQGLDVHGEATFVRRFAPGSVLDAGCGTGRVAIELARHGITTLGVDVDASMLTQARKRAPELEWGQADLATLDLGRRFDVVLMAGNVPLFCPPADRAALVERCARHVAPGGHLVAGFSLGPQYSLDEYDAAAERAGLVLEARFSSWDAEPFEPGSVYGVSVHRQPS